MRSSWTRVEKRGIVLPTWQALQAAKENLYVTPDRPVSSVGREPDYRAGGLGFEPQDGPTLRVLK